MLLKELLVLSELSHSSRNSRRVAIDNHVLYTNNLAINAVVSERFLSWRQRGLLSAECTDGLGAQLLREARPVRALNVTIS